jgi:RimJ/RimL family protein N-acetyltransferase
MNIFPVFTERLILRHFQSHDVSAFVAYRSDPEIARYQSWSSTNEDEARSFMRQQQQTRFGVPGEWFQIAIARKETDALIGDVGVQIKSHDPASAEIGFTLSRENQGKGYASEAVRKVLSVLFEETGVERVEGVTDSRNKASIELLQRVGMSKERVEQTLFKGAPCVEYTFVIKKRDWVLSKAI